MNFKKRTIALLLAVTVFFCALPQSGVFAQENENLLYNPQFSGTITDSGTSVSGIDGWGLSKAGISSNGFSLEAGEDGYNILKIISTNDTVVPDAVLKKNIVLDADKYYRFSAQVKVEENEGDFYSAWGGIYIAYRYNNIEVYTSEKLRAVTGGWQELSFIIHGGEIPSTAWDRYFCIKVAGTRAAVSVKNPSLTVYSGEVGAEVERIQPQNLFSNGDFSQYDDTKANTENRFDGFSVASKGTVCLNHEQVFETVNGVENTPAAKLTYKKENTPKDALFSVTLSEFDKTQNYRLSAWIKIDCADAYNSETGAFEQTDSFDNSNGGYVKLHFDINNNYGGNLNIRSQALNTVSDWQYVSIIVDKSLYENATLWGSNPPRGGIVVNNMNCNVYIADLRLEEFVGEIDTAQDIQNGTVTLNRTNAAAGDEVFVKAIPDEGCVLLDNGLTYTYTDTSGVTHTEIISEQKKPVFTQTTTSGFTGTIYTEIGTTDPNVYYFDMPNGADITVNAVFASQPEFMDANFDGNVDIRDLIRLKKFATGLNPVICLSSCDANFDGDTNAYDLTVFRRSLLYPDSLDTLVNTNLELWVTDPLERVLKTAESNKQRVISLAGAKGEYESFQIVADTDIEGITLNELVISDFTDNKGNVISADNYVTVYREHYVTVSYSSPSSTYVSQDAVGEIPDALIPVKDSATGKSLGNTARFYAFPFTLSDGNCQPFFIDVEIPRSAVAGEYTAQYEMITENGRQGGEIRLTVWDISLSETQIQGSYFGTRTDITQAKREVAAQNRIFISSSDADEEAELNSKYGYNNANLGFWSGVDISTPDKEMKAAPTAEQVETAVAKHLSSLNLFAYTADEISGRTDLYDTIIEYAKVLHQGGVKQLITMPPVDGLLDDGLGNNRSAVDIWVMLPKQFDSNTEMIAKARQKTDSEIWTYNCLVQDNYSPKWLLDYPLINFRIHTGFINYAKDVNGFLYWAIDNYESLSDPWTALNDNTSTVYNGDGKLFYPSEDVGIDGSYVASLRVKAIRDGFEDYELLKAIEQISGEKVDTSAVAEGFGTWTQKNSVLLENRVNLGDLVS